MLKKLQRVRLYVSILLIAVLSTTVGLTVNATGKAGIRDTDQTVTICMTGDMLLHDRVLDSGQKSDNSYCYDSIFLHTADQIREADIAIVNEEVILGGTKLGLSGYPAFNGPFEAGDALVLAGFDVVCHGTNHALDKGTKGIESCLNFWNTSYPQIAVLGIHNSQKSYDDIYIREEKGIRIAILNYTYGTNGIEIPSSMPYAVDLLEKKKVVSDLKRAQREADFVIVCPHWGTEYLHGISAEQEKWTDVFAENGADLVLGTHPHVIEPVEMVKRPDGGYMLVYYSLGNFVNATSGTGKGTADRMLGAMAQITLKCKPDGAIQIADYDAMPLICHIAEGYGKITVYPMDEYTEKLAQENEIRKQDQTFSLGYCQNLWTEVMGKGDVGKNICKK